MIPPLLRRCPDCGHLTLAVRFEAVDDGDGGGVACPACGHEFEPVEGSWLL